MPTTTAEAIGDESLLHWLQDFQQRFNSNGRAAKLATGWDRQLLVDSTDTGVQYTLTVADAGLRDIREGGVDPDSDEKLVTMSAEDATLIRIFSGDYNPSTALIDGQLEVYSDARDKVKLEALAMVIWGI